MSTLWRASPTCLPVLGRAIFYTSNQCYLWRPSTLREAKQGIKKQLRLAMLDRWLKSSYDTSRCIFVMFDMTRAYISFAKFLCQGNWSIRVRGFCPAGPQALWREDQGLRDELGRGARRCHGGGDRRRRHVEAVDGNQACARQVEGEEERDGRQQGVGSEIRWKKAKKESERPRWTR